MPPKPAKKDEPPFPEFLLTRQPVFNRESIVVGYEVLHHAYWLEPPAIQPEPGFVTQALMTTLTNTGLTDLAGGKKVFINANAHFLQHLPSNAWPSARVGLEVPPEMAEREVYLAALTNLAKLGYQVVIDQAMGATRDLGQLAKIATLAKVSLRLFDSVQLTEAVSQLKLFRLPLLAEGVETQEDWANCRRLGFDFFQGYFFCQPRALLWKRADASRMTVMRTLARIQNPEADFHSLGRIIAEDASLSHRLLALVNSPAYALSRTINSIEQAVGFLGLNQLRAWLTLLTMASIPGKPPELTNQAMLRAKMCELLSPFLAQRKSDAFFIVGLFSVLDALLDTSMGEVIRQLTLAPDIVEGLVHHRGAPGEALKMALAYERANWEPLLRTGLRPDVFGNAFRQAVRWTSDIDRSMSD